MSKDSAILPTCMCDIHHDDVAQALCHYHKKLLCLGCVLEKAKNPECSLVEIRKVSGGKDSLLLKCLSVRQIAAKKERLTEEHKNKTSTLKDKLVQEVTEMHGKLTKRLDEMKENCLKSIDKQLKPIRATDELNKQRLVTLETAINAHIDMLSMESAEDETEIRTILNDMTTDVMDKIPDEDSVPEGEFKPNSHLTELILRSDASLGSVFLIDPKRDLSSKVIYSSSDEVFYDAVKNRSVSAELGVKPETIYCLQLSTEHQIGSDKTEQTTQISDKSDTVLSDGKSGKRQRGIFKWFSSDKRKTDHSDKQEKRRGTDTKNEKRESTAAVKKIISSKSCKQGTESIYQESTTRAN